MSFLLCYDFFNSPKPWRVLIPSFQFFCKFCQLGVLPFHFILFPLLTLKTHPNLAWLSLAQLGSAWLGLAHLGSAWLSLAQLGSAWLSFAQLGSAWLSLAQLGLAQLGFCFTIFLYGIFSPNLASFSPKPFGHVYITYYHEIMNSLDIAVGTFLCTVSQPVLQLEILGAFKFRYCHYNIHHKRSNGLSTNK